MIFRWWGEVCHEWVNVFLNTSFPSPGSGLVGYLKSKLLRACKMAAAKPDDLSSILNHKVEGEN